MANFKEEIYELAFGDNAINRDYSEEEVINALRTIVNPPVQEDEHDNPTPVHVISVGFHKVFNVEVPRAGEDGADEALDFVNDKVCEVGVIKAMYQLAGVECCDNYDDVLVQFEHTKEG